MFNALSIRKKFYGFGGLMAAVALIIGTIGYWGIARQGSELDGVVITSLALRNHLESDMMHDALRADVLGALRAARDSNKEDLAAVKADVADHSQNFRERIAANKGLTLSDEVRAAISEVEPKLDSYISTAESMIALAEKDSPAAEAAYPPFLANFEELEGSLSKLSDLIAASAQSANESAHGTASLAESGLIVALLIGIVILAGLIFVMVRGICTPLDAMAGAMGTLAAGDNSVAIPALGRKDEIGNMAAAMQMFKDNAVRAEQMAAEQRAEQEAKLRRTEMLERRTASFDSSVSAALKTVTAATSEMQANAACAVRHRRADQQAGDGRLRRFGRSDQQRADGGRRDRAALGLDRRDQPPGRPVRRHRQQGRGGSRAHQRAGPQPGRRGARRSAKW